MAKKINCFFDQAGNVIKDQGGEKSKAFQLNTPLGFWQSLSLLIVIDHKSYPQNPFISLITRIYGFFIEYFQPNPSGSEFGSTGDKMNGFYGLRNIFK